MNRILLRQIFLPIACGLFSACSTQPIVCKPRAENSIPIIGSKRYNKAIDSGLKTRDSRHQADWRYPKREDGELSSRFAQEAMACARYGYWRQALHNFRKHAEHSPVLHMDSPPCQPIRLAGMRDFNVWIATTATLTAIEEEIRRGTPDGLEMSMIENNAVLMVKYTVSRPGNQDLVEALLDRVEDRSRDWRTRMLLAKTLENRCDDKHAQRLLSIVKDPTEREDVRIGAIDGIYSVVISSPPIADSLREVLAMEGTPPNITWRIRSMVKK